MDSADFDWVTATAGCNAQAKFTSLLAGVRRDVERRNAVTGRGDDFHFEVHEEEERFEVSRASGSGFGAKANTNAFVAFEREGPRINVHGDGVDVEFTTIVGVTHAGDCAFFIGEVEYSEWHIRKLALEELFFEESEE